MAGVKTWFLVGLLGSLLVIGFFGATKYWGVLFHDIRVVNELPEYRIALVNRKKLEEYLHNQGFLGNKGFKKIAIVFTSYVDEPMVVESDADGNPLISAKSGSKGGLLVIWVKLADNVFEGIEDNRRGRWLDKIFWEVIVINQRRIANSVANDIEPALFDIFMIQEK